MERAEHVGELELAGYWQALGICLLAEPQGALHQHVEEDVVLPQKLPNGRLGVAPIFAVQRRVEALSLQSKLAERDRSDQRVGPHVQSLASQIRVERWQRNAPIDVSRDRTMRPFV